MTDAMTDLTGKFLIAMPSMDDPRFRHSVILMCAHSGDGAMGLIVNKRFPDITLSDLLGQLGIEGSGSGHLHFGGPVETARGFVLHTNDYGSEAGTLEIGDSLSMTATRDILEDIAQGTGPQSALTALGYAGWGPGQLENELRRNDWLTVESDSAIVFDPDDEGKWARALAKLGIDPHLLSAEGGSA